jgi:hypothetical protein
MLETRIEYEVTICTYEFSLGRKPIFPLIIETVSSLALSSSNFPRCSKS